MSDLTRREFVERGAAAAAAGLLGVRPVARPRSNDLTIQNDLITATWVATDGVIRPRDIVDRLGDMRLTLPEQLFTLTLADGSRLEATHMRVVGTAATDTLVGSPTAARFAERVSGHRLTIILEDPDRRLRAVWRAELRERARYLRQEVTLHALGAPLAIREIALVDFHGHGAQATGTVKGSPVTLGQWFVGFEHPLSQSTVDGDHVRCVLGRELPLRPESP